MEDHDNVFTKDAFKQQFGSLRDELVDDFLEKTEQVHVAHSAESALATILVPDRCKLQDIPTGLEKWEALVRRHERSKPSGTMTAVLDEEIKTDASGVVVPSELKQHLALKTCTTDQVRTGSDIRTTLKPAEVCSHSSELQHRTFQIQ